MRKILIIIFIFLWGNPSKADSVIQPIQTSIIDNSIIEMDLIGDGKTEKIKKEFCSRQDSRGYLNEQLTMYRLNSTGESEKLWVYLVPEAVRIDVVISALDPNKPRKSFLILNCWFGASACLMHVFQWNRKTFEEVHSDEIWGLAETKVMSDRRNVITVSTGDYGEGPADIYIYQKNCLLPGNFLYPDFYQNQIESTFKELKSNGDQPFVKHQILANGIMAFLYGGKISEGIEVYNELEQSDAVAMNTKLFRAYSYLETGDRKKGQRELLQIHEHKHYERLQESWMNLLLGNYYYTKNDFEKALKYYNLVDEAHVNINPQLWKKKKELLEYLAHK